MATRPQRLSESEVQERLQGLQGWAVTPAGMLEKQFRFKSFMHGMAFVNKVAEVAEAMDHHPDIMIRFGLITISLVTHSARGLTALDFEQASKLEGLA